ncbi:hypothetical protein E2C01_008050 [Portunus trituberculatus]|uniref:Uncharacterized protein n=1 Tax=Portunus trituberculatus TaxID=210409 RepID=A0A5B7D2W3_PORTR|nr:hypothetical protein [Portunus trituberculatus]
MQVLPTQVHDNRGQHCMSSARHWKYVDRSEPALTDRNTTTFAYFNTSTDICLHLPLLEPLAQVKYNK